MTNWPGNQGSGLPPHDRRGSDPHDDTHVIPRFKRPQQPPQAERRAWPSASGPNNPAHPWAKGVPVQGLTGSEARPWRTKRLGLLTAAAVAVAAVSAGVAFTGSSTEGAADSVAAGSNSAAETVVAYLEALGRGDAAAALSYGKSQPADTRLLTDEVLRSQVASMPISDIEVEKESQSGTGGSVSAEVSVKIKFGGTNSDITMGLTRVGDEWKVDHAFNELHIAEHTAAVGTLTILGKKLTQRETLSIFPGSLELATSNDYIDVAFASPLPGQTPVTFRPKVELNDHALEAVLDTAAQGYAKCEGATVLAPPGCMTKIDDPDVVEGSVIWGRADLSGVAVRSFNDQRMFAHVAGAVRIPISGRMRSGASFERIAVHQLSEDVDLKTSPPKIIG